MATLYDLFISAVFLRNNLEIFLLDSHVILPPEHQVEHLARSYVKVLPFCFCFSYNFCLSKCISCSNVLLTRPGFYTKCYKSCLASLFGCVLPGSMIIAGINRSHLHAL